MSQTNNCPKCQHRLTPNAQSCVFCGYGLDVKSKVPKQSIKFGIISLFLFIILVNGIAFWAIPYGLNYANINLKLNMYLYINILGQISLTQLLFMGLAIYMSIDALITYIIIKFFKTTFRQVDRVNFYNKFVHIVIYIILILGIFIIIWFIYKGFGWDKAVKELGQYM